MSRNELDNLEYEEYAFRLRMINDEINKTMKNNLIVSAFTVWQSIETKLSFSNYLKKLNLHEKTLPIPKDVIDNIDKENIELSKKIMKADKKRRL